MANGNITIERSWDILTDAAGVNTTKHTVQFMPTLEKVNLSAATQNVPAHLRPPTAFSLDSLFTNSLGITKEDKIVKSYDMTTYPNPFNPECNITFNLEKSHNKSLKLYNSMGQELKGYMINNLKSGLNHLKIDGSKLNSGTYIVKIVENKNQTLFSKSITLLK